MTVAVRPLLFKPHRLNVLSDKLLDSHYENNYGNAFGGRTVPLDRNSYDA